LFGRTAEAKRVSRNGHDRDNGQSTSISHIGAMTMDEVQN